jgi:hypothetical protein
MMSNKRKEYEPTYWGHKGKYQKEYNIMVDMLVPSQGNASTKQGQLLLCVSNLYHERYNNGWGNRISHYTDYIRKYMKTHKLDIKITQKMSEKDFDKAIDAVIKHLIITEVEPCDDYDKVY